MHRHCNYKHIGIIEHLFKLILIVNFLVEILSNNTYFGSLSEKKTKLLLNCIHLCIYTIYMCVNIPLLKPNI